MPDEAGGSRPLRKWPVYFWLAAVLAASADPVSKHLVFDWFSRRHPEIAGQMVQFREAELGLAGRAEAAGQGGLAGLARRELLADFVREAEAAGQFRLAQEARELARRRPGYPPRVVVAGFLQIVRSENRGGVFGLGQGSGLWVVFGVAAGVLVAWFAHRRDARSVAIQVALGLVLGGAAGNVFDRLVFGYVRDFIDVCYWPGRHWPAFNVADAGICVGAVFLAFHALVAPAKKREKRERRRGG